MAMLQVALIHCPISLRVALRAALGSRCAVRAATRPPWRRRTPDVVVAFVGDRLDPWNVVATDPPYVAVLATPGAAGVLASLAAGAASCVAADTPPATLARIVRETASGRRQLCPRTVTTLVDAALSQLERRIPALTPSEHAILMLSATGRTDRQIAGLRGASVRTIQAHRANVMRKLGAHNKSAMVWRAIELGLLRVTPRPSA